MDTKCLNYKSFKPASDRASAAGKGASRKVDTKPELILRDALLNRGIQCLKALSTLPGKPDLAFINQRLVVFCDGDFWHGKDWEKREKKLSKGHNALYWISKIKCNVERDRKNNAELIAQGWKVLRFWESEIKNNLEKVVMVIIQALDELENINSTRK